MAQQQEHPPYQQLQPQVGLQPEHEDAALWLGLGGGGDGGGGGGGGGGNGGDGGEEHQLQEGAGGTLHASVTDRLHTQFALHPLTYDETITYRSMLERDEDAEVFVMPNHHIDETGTFHGFRLVVGKHSDCVNLPVTREMFHGHTCVECDPSDRDIHPDVIRLLTSPADIKAAVLGMLAEIAAYAPETMAGLEHMPVYGDTESVAVTADDNCTGLERNQILLENLIAERIGHHSTTMRGRDSRQWNCDMPSGVGVYHAHVRSRDSGRRHHKLFIIVSGGTRRASEHFYNMNLDLLGSATASELESCEEAWWLRRTNTRCRCRLAQKLADALQLHVPTGVDVFDFDDGASLPVHTTDTFDHTISETDDGRVALFNECCDSTAITNGIICKQHPTEGMWVFQGSQQSAVGSLSNFGGVFGHQETCGAFPTGTFHMYEDSYQDGQLYSAAGGVSVQQSRLQETRLNLHKERASSHVLHYSPVDGTEVSGEDLDLEASPEFVKMDDAFVKHLESHAWNREYQIVQLIPIINAVEHVPHWLKS